MTLGIRPIATTTGLVLLTAIALGWLVHSGVEIPLLVAAVAGIQVVAILLTWNLARGCVTTGARSPNLDRLTAASPANSNELTEESNKRQKIESAWERYAQRGRMFSAAMDQASYPIVTQTLDGTITAWNPAAERLYGYTSSEAVGKNIDIIIAPDCRNEHSSLVQKSLADEPVENFETVRATKSGQKIHVSLSLRPVKSLSGEIIGVAKITRDIAEQKFAEEKFRLAVESCPSGMLMVERNGKVVLVNTAVERLFGYRREELIGQSVDVLVPARLRGRHAIHREDFTIHPAAHRIGAGRELCGLRKDGTEFPIEVLLNPIPTHEGPLILGVILDISERKRLERLKDEFVSTVSHELRTPLTSISGSLGLLIGGAAGKLTDPAARLVTIAQTNSQRLVRLVNDILDIEKMESGQIAFNFKPVEVRALVEQTIEANRGFADDYGVRVRLDPKSAVGDLHADPDRLAQVVTNLLSNAIKFSPPNGEVAVAIERRGRLVRISVRDHGPGISADFKPHVFEKFAQADATDAGRKGGTGLGLSIVRQIVTRLSGTVEFEAAAGGGTIFHVDLPGREHVAEQEIDADEQPGAARILLCADDPNAGLAVREGLRQFGFATDLAHTRADALTRAAAGPYGAIVVDLELPDGESAGLIGELRRRQLNGKTPIIGMAANTGRDPNTPPLSEPDDWVGKPTDIDRLAQILDRAMADDVKRRPHILHVDDDSAVLKVVARALGASANVISAKSIEEARQALATHRFDLAVLDIELGPVSGLDLLPELRGGRGRAIPVIIFSAHGANLVSDPLVQARLSKSRAALDSLVATVHDRLRPHPTRAPREIA
jgi:PAS domain S-box-containing protein